MWPTCGVCWLLSCAKSHLKRSPLTLSLCLSPSLSLSLSLSHSLSLLPVPQVREGMIESTVTSPSLSPSLPLHSHSLSSSALHSSLKHTSHFPSLLSYPIEKSVEECVRMKMKGSRGGGWRWAGIILLPLSGWKRPLPSEEKGRGAAWCALSQGQIFSLILHCPPLSALFDSNYWG